MFCLIVKGRDGGLLLASIVSSHSKKNNYIHIYIHACVMELNGNTGIFYIYIVVNDAVKTKMKITKLCGDSLYIYLYILYAHFCKYLRNIERMFEPRTKPIEKTEKTIING